MDFDPVASIADWLRNLLMNSWNLDGDLTEVILNLIGAVVVGGLVMLIFILQTWIERKTVARIQDRIGP